MKQEIIKKLNEALMTESADKAAVITAVRDTMKDMVFTDDLDDMSRALDRLETATSPEEINALAAEALEVCDQAVQTDHMNDIRVELKKLVIGPVSADAKLVARATAAFRLKDANTLAKCVARHGLKPTPEMAAFLQSAGTDEVQPPDWDVLKTTGVVK